MPLFSSYMGWGRKPGDLKLGRRGRRTEIGTPSCTHSIRWGSTDSQYDCGRAVGGAYTARRDGRGCTGTPGSYGETLLSHWATVLTCELGGDSTKFPIAVAGVAIPAGLAIERGKNQRSFDQSKLHYYTSIASSHLNIYWDKLLSALCYLRL